MPNHETNTVVVLGPPENVQKFLDEAFDEGKIDFNKIVPYPDALKDLTAEFQVFSTQEEADAHQAETAARYASFGTGFGADYVDKVHALTVAQRDALVQEHGPALDWYKWNVSHWGTKWNAYSHGEVKHGVYRDHEGKVYARVDFTFETAWSQPTPIFEQIELKYDVELHAVTQDEGGFPDVEYGAPYEQELLSRQVIIQPENWDNLVTN